MSGNCERRQKQKKFSEMALNVCRVQLLGFGAENPCDKDVKIRNSQGDLFSEKITFAYRREFCL